jgi:hypothetical protein
VNMLSKHSQTASKGWPSTLGMAKGLTTFHCKILCFGSGKILWNELSSLEVS